MDTVGPILKLLVEIFRQADKISVLDFVDVFHFVTSSRESVCASCDALPPESFACSNGGKSWSTEEQGSCKRTATISASRYRGFSSCLMSLYPGKAAVS